MENYLGNIEGLVLTSQGTPLAESTVFVVTGPSHHDLASMTDEKGRFSLHNLIPGKYLLQVNSNMGSSNQVMVEVNANRVTGVEILFNNPGSETDAYLVEET